MPAISQSRGRSPVGVKDGDRGRLPGALAVVGRRRHADVEGRDCCVRQRRHELRGDQPVAGAPRVQPGGQLAAPVAVGPLHAVALGDQLGEPAALVVVEDPEPRSLRVRAGTQLVGQADGQRPLDEAVTVRSPQLDRGVQALDLGERGDAAVQAHDGQQIGVDGVGEQPDRGRGARVPGGHAHVEQCRATADHQLAVVGIVHGQRARAVRAHVDDAGPDRKEPRLRVVR